MSRLGQDIGIHRRIHPTNVAKSTGASDSGLFHDLIGKAMDIGLTPQDMEDMLVERTGFGDAVRSWAREKKTPNGLVRKIILTNLEKILLEYGARPHRSVKELQPVT